MLPGVVPGGCNNAGFVLNTVGNCEGFEFISTSTECSVAARSLGLDSIDPKPVDNTGGQHPFGCYFKPQNVEGSQLFFNTFGNRDDDDTIRVSACRCAQRTNPHPPPPLYLPRFAQARSLSKPAGPQRCHQVPGHLPQDT